MNDKRRNLIWIDLEMTGLDTQHDWIIEIATVVTDAHLNIVATGPNLAIFQPPEIIEKMDAWNQRHHSATGLIERIQHSSVSAEEAQSQTLAFLQEHVPANTSPMCGNTVCQDRRFMSRLMPQLEAYFHYRHLDVSTIKELAKIWSPSIYNGVKKESKHSALADIKESIEELRYYRDHFFKLETSGGRS